jgi:hypothetical protein
MNPYTGLPKAQFWKASVESPSLLDVGFDFGKKFDFSPGDVFATAGSCFAQHFAKQLVLRGGKVLHSEERHPIVPADADHGYGAFSARYGNLYTVRQLRELLEQALGLREFVVETAQRTDGRWVDMLRPRAVPMGFESHEHACADRAFHLHAVRQMLGQMDVFLFTLGLTETWVNTSGNYCYPVVPGAIAGRFDAALHGFRNFRVSEIVSDLEWIVRVIAEQNPAARVLFTVSPVALVATAEARSVVVSTSASKSILRAAVDEVVDAHAHVDYFPSYEIITSAPTQSRFWAEGLRDVTEKGVATVMEIFFGSRMPGIVQETQGVLAEPLVPVQSRDEVARKLDAALTSECDEMFLDPSLRSSHT